MIGAGFIVYSLVSPEIFFRKYSEVQNKAELTAKIFRTTTQTITYDDPDGTRKTIKTHKGDLVMTFTGIKKKGAFSYEFVSNKKI